MLIKLPGIQKLTGTDLPIDAVETLKAIDRYEFERSLYDFTVAAWSSIDPAPFVHGGFVLQAICEHLEACVDGEIRNLIINVPPRFSKSTICGTMLPAWTWAQQPYSPISGPGAQFLYASYSLGLAQQDSVKCRRLIESEWYQGLWGDRYSLNTNTVNKFDNNRNGVREIASIGASTTGKGGDYLVLDDPNNALEANSEAILKTTTEWFDTAWSTRLNNPKTGVRIVIQQRLSEGDITGHILSKDRGDYVHLLLPMRYEPERSFATVIGWTDPRTEPGELLWPERFGEEETATLESNLGPFGAAGQLQQRPDPKGGGILKREWWQDWTHPVYPPMTFVVASLDTAFGTKQENDYSALTVWGLWDNPGTYVDADGNERQRANAIVTPASRVSMGERLSGERAEAADVANVMLMSGWAERLELHRLVTKVAETCRKMKVDLLLIENKASGISVHQELRRLYRTENFGVRLLDPKGMDKVSRVYAIQHLFSEGLIYAPTSKTWADNVITQCTQFPKGKHDDIVDTVSQALRWLRSTGMINRAAERIADIEESMRFTGNEDVPLYPV